MSEQLKILLIEDDESLGFVIKDNLEEANYQVHWAKDGSEGWDAYQQQRYDLCVLDVMLPKMDGFSVLQEIRQTEYSTPVIMLTARNMQEDKLTGFRHGADDYVVKPFDMRELLLRIEVFIRRTKSQEVSSGEIQIGQFTFDVQNYQLKGGHACATLTEREAMLLKLFCEHRNVVVKREQILEQIWGENDYFLGRSLDVFVSRLRKHLRPDSNIEIINQHGVGFKLSIAE